MENNLILKSKNDLKKEKRAMLYFLSRSSKLSFWNKHLANKKFKVQKKHFDWDYFSKIPFIEKSEILKIGLDKRIKDAEKEVKKNTIRFLLQSTSGTSRTTAPVLFLKNVDEMIEGAGHRLGKRMLILYQGRAIALRDTIAMINRNKSKDDNFSSLVVNPFVFEESKVDAITQFYPDSIVTFPACITYLASTFPKTSSIFSLVKYLFLSGDFISRQQFTNTKKMLTKRNSRIDIDYLTTEVDAIGICCDYLRQKHGTNAYHPYSNRIVELINIDENGIGEVVVTKTDPFELAIVRYKTGDLARGENKKCKCANEWTLLLEGRANMDYIKSLGTLIARAEIDRVIKTIPEIADWRGEVREVNVKGAQIGELTLFLLLSKPSKIVTLAKKISNKLLLTPKKTLADLEDARKFMPLKIKLVDEFAQTAKKAPLRKIIE